MSELTGIAADWVIRGRASAPSISGGAVVLAADGKTLVAVGPKEELELRFPTTHFRSLHGVLMPGLINTSVALEDEGLSVRGGEGQFAFDVALAGARSERGDEISVDDVRRRCAKIAACGTAAVGVVSTTLLDVSTLSASGLVSRVFHPIRGMREETAAVMLQLATELHGERSHGLRVQNALHSIYALHPKAVAVVLSRLERDEDRVFLPLCTGPVERASLLNGSGPFDAMLAAHPESQRDWPVPACDPVSYATQLDALCARTVVASLLDATAGELGRVAAWCTHASITPRQNLLTDARLPDVATMHALGLSIALGTGSVAAVPDGDVLEEVAALAARFPQMPAQVLLSFALDHGARALGVQACLGTLEEGKSPGVVGVAFDTRVEADPATFVLRERRRPREVLAKPSES